MGPPDPRDFLPLPAAQFHILAALSAGELHGYAIMQTVESSSDGLVKIGPATLYWTINRLVDDGLAEEVAKPPSPGGDARRRYYRLTGLGGRVPEQPGQFNFVVWGGAGCAWRLTPQWALNVGYRFVHLSNAGPRNPNSGLNFGLPLVGLSYSFP